MRGSPGKRRRTLIERPRLTANVDRPMTDGPFCIGAARHRGETITAQATVPTRYRHASTCRPQSNEAQFGNLNSKDVQSSPHGTHSVPDFRLPTSDLRPPTTPRAA